MNTNVLLVGVSKNPSYENPYSVTGTIKLTGLKEAPKGIWTDKEFWNVGLIGHGGLTTLEVVMHINFN